MSDLFFCEGFSLLHVIITTIIISSYDLHNDLVNPVYWYSILLCSVKVQKLLVCYRIGDYFVLHIALAKFEAKDVSFSSVNS